MEDSNVPFADTTARRAQLMAATQQYRTTITEAVDTIKDNAEETGKTVGIVAGAALIVFLLASVLLPKSDEYRYAEKYGEPEDHKDDRHFSQSVAKFAERGRKNNKASGPGVVGLLGGLLTPVLTNIARQQLSQYMARMTNNDATQSKPAIGSFQPFS
jgi:hypothetical protein